MIGVAGTLGIKAEGDSGPWLESGVPIFIDLETNGLRGQHTVRLRWVDEGDRYLPGEALHRGTLDGDEDGWRITEVAVLRLEPPRAGMFRLLIELDGQLIGWIPLAVELVTTTKGES